MLIDRELEMLATRVKLRIAFVAANLDDFDKQKSLKRFELTPDVIIYAHLYAVSEHSLLDVETNKTSIMELVKEHSEHSSGAWEFNVANGTNVRLHQGESIICRGKDEHVSMKLSHDGLVTYRDPDASKQLLTQTIHLLESQVRADVKRVSNMTTSLYPQAFRPAYPAE